MSVARIERRKCDGHRPPLQQECFAARSLRSSRRITTSQARKDSFAIFKQSRAKRVCPSCFTTFLAVVASISGRKQPCASLRNAEILFQSRKRAEALSA